MPKDESIENKTNTVSTKPIKNNKTITVSQNGLFIFLAIVILVALAFIGGTIYQKNSQSNLLLRLSSQKSFNHRQHSFKDGTITAISSSSITINNQKLGSLSFNLSASTKIRSAGQTISLSSLKSGQKVLIKTTRQNSSQARLIIVTKK